MPRGSLKEASAQRIDQSIGYDPAGESSMAWTAGRPSCTGFVTDVWHHSCAVLLQ